MWCPNPDCPHRRNTGQPGEYRADVDTCPECGASLVDDPPLGAAEERAVPRPLVRRLWVTGATVLALALLSRVPLPTVDWDVLEAMLGASAFAVAPQLGVMALGTAPLLTGFALVELVAMIIPPLRRRRHGDRLLRARLHRASFAVGVVAALVQGLSLALYLESLSYQGYYGYGASVAEPGWSFRASTILTLCAGTCLCAAAARLIDLHGVGPGFAVVVGVDLLMPLPTSLLGLWRVLSSGLVAPLGLLALLVPLALLAGATWWFLRRRPASIEPLPLRLPTCGVWPLALAASLPMLLVSIFNLTGWPWLEPLIWRLAPGRLEYLALEVILVVLLAPPVSQLCYWRRRADFAAAGQRRRWRHALFASTLFLLTMVGLWFVALRIVDDGLPLPSSLAVALLVAIVADLSAEVSARRRAPEGVDLVPLEAHHDVADALEALAAAGDRGAVIQGLHFRSLTYFLAPFVPMHVLVPARRNPPGVEQT